MEVFSDYSKHSSVPHGLYKPKECNTSTFVINTALSTGITSHYTEFIYANNIGILVMNNFIFRPHEMNKVYIFHLNI